MVNLDTVYHGIATPLTVTSSDTKLYNGIAQKEMVGRYHSWIVSKENFPDVLEITAVDENNYIMGLQHRKFDVQGVQFHPESVLTPCGETIIRNWLSQ